MLKDELENIKNMTQEERKELADELEEIAEASRDKELNEILSNIDKEEIEKTWFEVFEMLTLLNDEKDSEEVKENIYTNIKEIIKLDKNRRFLFLELLMNNISEENTVWLFTEMKKRTLKYQASKVYEEEDKDV